jgi:hypothetical protein
LCLIADDAELPKDDGIRGQHRHEDQAKAEQ